MGIDKCHASCVWALLLAVVLAAVPRYTAIEIQVQAAASEPALPPPPVQFFRGAFERNATLTTTLAAYDVPNELARAIADAVRPVFNVRSFRTGQEFRIVREPDGAFRSFEYIIDDTRVLRVEQRENSVLDARVEELPLDTYTETLSASVDSSLWAALSGFPKPDGLVMELVNVFDSQVDFYRDIRRGDAIRFVVEAMYHRGQFVKYGQIRAAEFVNNGKKLQAYRFRDEYYDENGLSTRRSLLPAPLEFTRISSNFSNARLHPILNRVRAHRGTDYAAPTGTPVWAAADGVVTFAGTNGGYGRMVQLRHPNGMVTEYAHLSRVLVRVGEPVRQRHTIGLVGMTGTATGPHLHYQLMINGRYVNPRAVRIEPPKPIDPSLKEQYLASIVDLQLALDNLREGPAPAMFAEE